MMEAGNFSPLWLHSVKGERARAWPNQPESQLRNHNGDAKSDCILVLAWGLHSAGCRFLLAHRGGGDA